MPFNKPPFTKADSHRIMDAYAAYDTDARAHGPDDLDAFQDAVLPLLTPAPTYVAVAPHCDMTQFWT